MPNSDEYAEFDIGVEKDFPLIPQDPDGTDDVPSPGDPLELLYALGLAKCGFPVLPLHAISKGCCTCGSAPCGAAGKHPRTPHGKDDATTDPQAIRSWWSKWPMSNVGIATGELSESVVVDIDPRHGGEETISQLQAMHGPLPPAPVVRSGGGGRHIFFCHPGHPVKSKSGALGAGVDVKADGGYVVAPPSSHMSGGKYDFDRETLKIPLPPLPDWILRQIEEPTPTSSVPSLVIATGSRNETLMSLAGTMRRRGMSREAIEAALLEDNLQRCQTPLEESEVRSIAASASHYAPAAPVIASSTPYSEPGWPAAPEPAAFHGLAGEIVDAIAPHTEADRMALLSQLLTHYGNAIGRNPYFLAEADRHYTNLFMVLVGLTSKGRKGTSAGHIRRFFAIAEPQWEESRIMAGLSSGEGLIWAVHDPIEKSESIKEKGIVTGYQTVIVDPGVDDKRLLALESEFSSVLRVLGREGNILSAQLRQAWDTGVLRTLTKGAPTRASNAHISVIGHITREELLRELNSTEAANGFGNRFLWICSRRSKMLPEGGRVPDGQAQHLAGKLKGAIDFARTVGELKRNPAARGLWVEVYEKLSEGGFGLVGAVTSRAEAQTMRLAVIYALLDRSHEIRLEHLEAGLAFWKYAQDSARFIFGDSIGDTTADVIISALRSRPDGLTRNEIANLFSKHRSSSTIDNSLHLLQRLGLATSVTESTPGRSIERWFAAPKVAG